MLTTTGLLLDMTGVALLFFFPSSLPTHEKQVGEYLVAEEKYDAERKKRSNDRKRSNRISRLALLLLFLGFGLQIFGQ